MKILENVCYGTRREKDHFMDIYFYGGGITGENKGGTSCFAQNLKDIRLIQGECNV